MRVASIRTVRAAALAFSALVAVPLATAFPAAPAYARPSPDNFADLAEKLLPAVVNISSSTSLQARGGFPGPEMPMFPPGSPFEQFFKDFLDRNRPGGRQGQPAPQQPAPERRMQSLGSGFIIDPSGLVVTNNHVIEGSDEVTVTLQDNTSLKATIVGRDERVDVALLKVKADKPLPAVQFGDSDHERVGEWVLAIGNPFGLGGSVTAGIVSARGRDIRQGPYDDFIQTDAPINRGNSGGPLFNMDGEVIGINTAIYSPSGGSIGIGFAIPANMARTVVEQLREYGHARRGWLGVRIQQVTPDIAESLGLHEPGGAMVAGVNDGGPADKAKLRNGDIILKFNGQDVKEMRSLPRLVAETPIGQDVPVTIWRDGKQTTVQAKVGELPDDQQLAAATPGPSSKGGKTNPTEIAGLGLQVSPITPETKDKYQLNDDQKGVVVTDVAPNSPAADRGLKPGDVIVEVQQEPVSTPDDVQQRVDNVRKQSRRSVLMLIQGQDGLRWVPLGLGAGKDRQPG
ncbi:MAG: DegQ family serine endoprotease [Acetobacteraceae bacterium]|nr:DegQ family serine endoprotease [Acetobacteraceae bacterium]